MRFNTNEIRIKRYFPRSTVASVIAALIFAGIAAYALYQMSAANAALNGANVELTAAKNKVTELTAKVDKAKLELERGLAAAKDTCTNDATALQGQVAAFAKQAAACEVLRTKLAGR